MILVGAVGCTIVPDAPIALRFVADPGIAGEAYQCFGFDAALLGGADLGGIDLDAPAGPIALHHVALYASPGEFPDGPVACEAMPADALSLDVWAIGGGPLEIPDDIQLAIPEGTRRLIVQAHTLRVGDGEAASRQLVLTARRGALHRAGWLPLRAPTPALRPHQVEQSTATCIVGDELHIISTWPHMHEAGRAFRGAVIRDGVAEPYVSVDPWSYDTQHAVPIALAVAGGQALETHCVWLNETAQTILPGPSIHDEMCAQSLIAWPVEAAHCE